MADRPRRRHYRAAAAGDAHAAARLLVERLRAGELDRQRLEAAAALGHLPAQIATGLPADPAAVETGAVFAAVSRDDLAAWAWIVAERVAREHRRRWRLPDVAVAQDEVLRLGPLVLADQRDRDAVLDLEVAAIDLLDVVMANSPMEAAGPSWPLVYAAQGLTYWARRTPPDELGDVLLESAHDAARAAVAGHGVLGPRRADQEEARQQEELIALLLSPTTKINPYRATTVGANPRSRQISRQRATAPRHGGRRCRRRPQSSD